MAVISCFVTLIRSSVLTLDVTNRVRYGYVIKELAVCNEIPLGGPFFQIPCGQQLLAGQIEATRRQGEADVQED